jgi:hypothetical protein
MIQRAGVEADAAQQQSLQPLACVDPAPSVQCAPCSAWAAADADPSHCAMAA